MNLKGIHLFRFIFYNIIAVTTSSNQSQVIYLLSFDSSSSHTVEVSLHRKGTNADIPLILYKYITAVWCSTVQVIKGKRKCQ